MNPILAKEIKAIVEKRAFELSPGLLDSVFNHHTTAAIGGAGIGAGIGALSNSKKPGKGALIGAGIGAAAGLGGSHVLPEGSKSVNEFLVKNLVRKPVGKVLTNLIPPIGYDQKGDLSEELKNNSPLDFAKSVIKDKPIYEKDMLEHKYDDRDVPYRKAFDLPGRYGLDIYNREQNGSLSFNKGSKRGLMSLLSILDPTQSDHEHPILKKYTRSYNPDDSVSYKDVWDWDLDQKNPNEKLNNTQNIMRYFVNRIANPTTIEGKISPEDANDWRSRAKIPRPQ